MYAPLPAAVKPARVLFLSCGESTVRTDIKALRSAGMKECIHLADAPSAIAFLRAPEAPVKRSMGSRPPGNAVDLVVCDENLRDGPAVAFLYALAQERDLRSTPVLALAGTAASARELRAAGLHVLERPYSLAALEGAARKAMSPSRQPLRSEDFAKHKLPAQPKKSARQKRGLFTISDWYDKGIAHLKAGELPDAEHAFMRVLDGQEDHPEAALGLARLHHIAGDGQRVRRYLLRAAVSCLRQGDAERAKSIALRLPERISKNLYSSEGIACLEEGRSKAAAAAFLDAVREGDGKPLHQLVARACLQASRPEESMASLCSAFEQMGHTVTATALRRRLLLYTPVTPSAGELSSSSWLDSFPRVKEVVTVASHTAQVWKQARAY